jgi:hypothetical protein
MAGNVRGMRDLAAPLLSFKSLGLMLVARTLSSTSLSPHFGTAVSSYRNYDGSPYEHSRTAFMRISPRFCCFRCEIVAPRTALFDHARTQ